MSTLQINSTNQLETLLKQMGIDVSTWDGQNYKTLPDLFDELQHRDSFLCSDPLHGIVRHVNLVVVMLQYKHYLLVEKNQLHLDTRETRSRKLAGSLIEKLMNEESPREGAARLLAEEMEIESSVPLTRFQEGHHQIASPSYPGLQSCYHIHLIHCEMPEQLYKQKYQAEYAPWLTTWEWVDKQQAEQYFTQL